MGCGRWLDYDAEGEERKKSEVDLVHLGVGKRDGGRFEKFWS